MPDSKTVVVVMSACWLFCCVAGADVPTLDERAAGPGEWGYRPGEGQASEVDPPGFVWRPQ